MYLEHIISRMVLDKVCPVCSGITKYRTTNSAKTEVVDCKNCGGKGYMHEDEPCVLLVPDKSKVSHGVIQTMETQNMYVVDTDYNSFSKMRGRLVRRLYVYNVKLNTDAFNFLHERLQYKEKEIHFYYD